jgi:hypothetical protein
MQLKTNSKGKLHRKQSRLSYFFTTRNKLQERGIARCGNIDMWKMSEVCSLQRAVTVGANISMKNKILAARQGFFISPSN